MYAHKKPQKKKIEKAEKRRQGTTKNEKIVLLPLSIAAIHSAVLEYIDQHTLSKKSKKGVHSAKKCMIIDLHNDLLSYLVASTKDHTPYDLETRSSVDQYRMAHFKIVIYAAYTAQNSAISHHLQLQKQAHIFYNLATTYPGVFSSSKDIYEDGQKIIPFFAIENCACFAKSDEPMQHVFKRYMKVLHTYTMYPIYVSLTWNGINRFGAGSFSTKEEEKIGLTEDGEEIIDFLHDKITAFDISHASDTLAYDILHYLDKKKYGTSVVASHANFRSCYHCVRNLPDEIAQEIASRNGVIGLSCIKPFLGKTACSFARHIEHGLKIVGEKALSLGCDFFSLKSLSVQEPSRFTEHFFEELNSVEKIPSFFMSLEKDFGASVIQNILFNNAYERLITPHMKQFFT